MKNELPAKPDYSKIPPSIKGYRFKDLKDQGLLKTRTDAKRKQDNEGFPKPLRTGPRTAIYPENWLQAWLEWRSALQAAGRVSLIQTPKSPGRPPKRPSGTIEATAND